MSTAEREPWRQSSVTTASDESALMEKVAGIVSRTMSDHYGDKLTFEVGVERHFESWDNGDVDPYLYVEIVFSGDEQYIMKEISKTMVYRFLSQCGHTARKKRDFRRTHPNGSGSPILVVVVLRGC